MYDAFSSDYDRFVNWESRLAFELPFLEMQLRPLLNNDNQPGRVLDAACGEGYGTALLATRAVEAVGVDIDTVAVEHARRAYAGHRVLRYETGSATALPLADASVDVVVSFETVEHLPAAEQPAMLAEFARVLAPDGVLVISSPNRKRYSDDRGYANPFHLHEFYRDEFARLLDAGFPCRRWFHQAPLVASALWGEPIAGECEAWVGDGAGVTAMAPPEAMYYVVIAARTAAALPAPAPGLSLFTDRADSELLRAEANAREVMRLDALLRDRDAALDRQTGHVRHLEELVSAYDRVVAERDAQLASLQQERQTQDAALAARTAELTVQEAALAAQERVIAYRGSLRWWLRLPWFRAKRAWSRAIGR
jgi:SAM-dependent methyltransferase